jgi:PKD repeat protein
MAFPLEWHTMTNNFPRKWGAKIAFLIALLPSLANAQQYFTDSSAGDVDAGFRKTSSFQEQFEMVAYLGNITNFMAQTIGTTVTISNYSTVQLTNMCPNNFGNLQWSVFASFTGNLTNYWGNYSNLPAVPWPHETCWYTLTRTNNVQTTAPPRLNSGNEGTGLQDQILGVSQGANDLSQRLASSSFQGNTNINNDATVVLEPTSPDASPNIADNLSGFIGDGGDNTFGDFGGGAVDYTVENITSNTFSTAAVSDFYVNVPSPANSLAKGVDPLTGQTNGVADYLGYFTLNPNGSMTFTRAAAVSAPSVSSLTASVTNGFGPLTVVFSDSTSGSATNWVWNFGNGTIITNTTAGNVTNTYTLAGSFTVTLTVYGPGGSSSDTVAHFIVTSPAPNIKSMASSGQLIFNGSNCPAGVQYRILSSTNVLTTLANWTPIYTNTFASNGTFAFTNTIGKTNAFFIMVSP